MRDVTVWCACLERKVVTLKELLRTSSIERFDRIPRKSEVVYDSEITLKELLRTSSIERFDRIPRKSEVVFDWDNTLKDLLTTSSIDKNVDRIPRKSEVVCDSENTLKELLRTSSIESFVERIPRKSKVVFDWDNTLKKTSADRKHIECGLSKESLNILARVKQCSLYIISAIRPTRINLETLLIEVDKLGLRGYFCSECQRENFSKEVCSHNLKPGIVKGNNHTYFYWGNIVICAYDKAEVFLELLKRERDAGNKLEGAEECYDETDGLDESRLSEDEKFDDVYFFDDEDVNIKNFGQIVKNSSCILVTN